MSLPARVRPAKNSLAPLAWLGSSLVAGVLVLFLSRRLFPLPVEHSVGRIVHLADGSTAVEMDFTSHLARPVTKTARITLGYGGRGGAGFNPLAQRDVVVALQPEQTKRVTCTFADAIDRYPDRAEVTLLP